MIPNPDFVYVKRLKDGKIIEIPSKDVESTLRRGGFLKIEDISKVYENSEIQFPKKPDVIECPLCGEILEDNKKLASHKKTHK